MGRTIVNLLLLSTLFTASALCVIAPLTALAVTFWHWQKELAQSLRQRPTRSTQVR